MKRIRRRTVFGAATACLLVALFGCLARARPASPAVVPLALASCCPRPHTRFEAALAEARVWRQRAAMEVDRRREELEAWDPAAADPGRRDSAAHEPWRLRQLAADPGGYLRRALIAAQHAMGLARTAGERYRVVVLLAALEHEFGHPEQELQQARALVVLQPQNELSLLMLRRAALCCGRPSLAERIDGQLAALRQHEGRAAGHPHRVDSRWSPSTAPLIESRRHWIAAWNAAGEEQPQLQAWDPAASPAWVQAPVSRSPELRRADQSAPPARALAQSTRETYQSLRWLARVECALGRHREELRLAKQIASLAPRDQGSLTCLLQAAKCNGLPDLEKQTFVAMNRRQTPDARTGEPDRWRLTPGAPGGY